MFNNYYKVCIQGKNIRRIIKDLHKFGISFVSLNLKDNYFYAIIDKNNYEILKKFKTSYKIEVKRVYGLIHLKNIIYKNIFLLFFIFLSFVILLFLSNLIFKVEVVTDDIKLKNYILNVLSDNGISKYSFVKSYNFINNIKNKILSSNDKKVEWIEIERNGTKYTIKLEKRIINDIKNKKSYRHVIAKKNGIIKEIKASSGEILKKVNDYVSAGDTIISGEIHKGEDVLDNVPADGIIFAETWYKVKVSIPIFYYEKKILDNENKNILINFIDFKYNLFKRKFENSDISSKNLYSDFFGLFKINYINERETLINDSINTILSENIASKYAREKISEKLTDGEYIISQKKLKTTLNDSTIIVEVFFKIYENISQYKEYSIKKGLWYMLNSLYGNFKDVIITTWPMVFVSLIILISLRVAYLYKNHSNFVIYKEIMLFFFAFYVLSLFQIVTSSDVSSSNGSNFVPFKEIMRYKLFSDLFMKNVIGNVLLFLPYGYFIGKYFAGKSKKLSFFLITLASASIEFTQLYIGRVFDVDDILLNVIGGIIGYCLFLYSEKIYKVMPNFFKSRIFLDIFFIILLILFIIALIFLLT